MENIKKHVIYLAKSKKHIEIKWPDGKFMSFEYASPGSASKHQHLSCSWGAWPLSLFFSLMQKAESKENSHLTGW